MVGTAQLARTRLSPTDQHAVHARSSHYKHALLKSVYSNKNARNSEILIRNYEIMIQTKLIFLITRLHGSLRDTKNVQITEHFGYGVPRRRT